VQNCVGRHKGEKCEAEANPLSAPRKSDMSRKEGKRVTNGDESVAHGDIVKNLGKG